MSLLIKPIITEKATNDSELNNCYTFQVSKSDSQIIFVRAGRNALGQNGQFGSSVDSRFVII